jgi:hypothetical protein
VKIIAGKDFIQEDDSTWGAADFGRAGWSSCWQLGKGSGVAVELLWTVCLRGALTSLELGLTRIKFDSSQRCSIVI